MLREGGAEIVHVGVVAPVVAAVHAAHAVARALLGQVAARAAQHVRTRRADAATAYYSVSLILSVTYCSYRVWCVQFSVL